MEPKSLRPILRLIERRLWRHDDLDDAEMGNVEIVETEPIQ